MSDTDLSDRLGALERQLRMMSWTLLSVAVVGVISACTMSPELEGHP
jgi:hypothetical protein